MGGSHEHKQADFDWAATVVVDLCGVHLGLGAMGLEHALGVDREMHG